MKLYYSPFASSLAPHIALAASGLPYSLERVETSKGEHLHPSFIAKNPIGQVPLLERESGEGLTEVLAILHLVSALAPDRRLLPSDPEEQARALRWMSFFASSVHPAFVCFFKPSRYVDDEAIQAGLRAGGQERFLAQLMHMESGLGDRRSFLESGPSFVDVYASVFVLWALKLAMPVAKLPSLVALFRSQLEGAATQKALREEGIYQEVCLLAGA